MILSHPLCISPPSAPLRDRERLKTASPHPHDWVTSQRSFLACPSPYQRHNHLMASTYTAITKQDGDWWVGWIEEVPGVNAQERTKDELIVSLRQVLSEALEFNREDARAAAESNYTEELVTV